MCNFNKSLDEFGLIENFRYSAKVWAEMTLKCLLSHIWAHFFGHISAIFWPIGLKLFMVTKETIIYRLSMTMRIHGFDAF